MSATSKIDHSVDWQHSDDVLSALVRLVGLRGVVLASMELGAPWRVVSSEARLPVLHAVTKGAAVLNRDDAPKTSLSAGDVVLLPRGGNYELTHRGGGRRARAVSLPEPGAGQRCSIRAGGGGAKTAVTCCAFRFPSVSAAPLLGLLPPLVVVRAAKTSRGIRTFVDELVRESTINHIGTEGVVARLAELVFLCTLRAHFDTTKSAEAGLLAAVTDPQVGRALGLIHAALDAPWTVASLARKVGMSRAAFAQLFAAKTGQSPIRYIQLCRMAEAQRQLGSTGTSLGQIARDVGYRDAAAFSRAFRRTVCLSPREYRRATAGGR